MTTDAVTNSNTGNVKIEIKKNSGLTQALLEHVKSLDIFKQGTNIDWSKTLDKLAEIQEARKSSHGASIFRGGTEHGDWHNNFVVDEGPIEFTESEMKELYGAMGLNIESASESKEEVREEEAVAEEEVAEEEVREEEAVAEEEVAEEVVREEEVPAEDASPEQPTRAAGDPPPGGGEIPEEMRQQLINAGIPSDVIDLGDEAIKAYAEQHDIKLPEKPRPKRR